MAANHFSNDKSEPKQSQAQPRFSWPKLDGAIEGLIQLWVDISYILGKASTADELKPYVQQALAEPGSSVHRLVAPAEEGFRDYILQPRQVRLRRIGEFLSDEALRQALGIFQDGMCYVGTMNKMIGITFAEAERQICLAFEYELSNIKLGELLGKIGELPSKVGIHSLLCNLGLTPGAVAGADKRLKTVLTQRVKMFSGKMSYYEQDLKVALWDCSQTKRLGDEFNKMLDEQGGTMEQIQMLLRIVQRQKTGLVRGIFLRVLRKTIQELPDIHQEIRKAKQGERQIPFTQEMLLILPAQQPENTQDDILHMLTQRGVDVTRLNAEELNLLAEEQERLRLGRTRKEYYGPSEGKIKKRFSRLSNKLNAEARQ